MKNSILPKLKFLWVVCSWAFITVQANAQSTNYTTLYDNSTFVKTINLTLPTGTIGASANSVSGAATYAIPIVVPPGTNGVTPAVSVVYNSMTGSGVAGRGWSINGLSSITRVGQTIFHNGGQKPVELNANDRFALDGVRLMPISGTYGQSGTTYGLESETFSTITSNGTMSGGGPVYFSMVAKDGTIFEYGNTSDSRILNSGGTVVLFWRINKVTYPDGNYIEFKYVNTSNDSRVDEINYTGNAAAGLSPYNKLKFSYTVRSDSVTTYEAGVAMKSRFLLEKITVTGEGGVAFKTYTFNYGYHKVNSFLKEVIEAGSNGTQLNSTIFKYGDIPLTLQTGSSSAIAGQQVDVYTGDFNGDGFSDIMACTRNVVNNIVYHTEFKIYKKDPSPSNSNYTFVTSEALPANYIVFKPKEGANSFVFTSDYTGDAADDVVTVKTTGTGSSRVLNEIRLYKSQSNGTSFANPTIISPYTNYNKVHTSGNFFVSGDFNGDGVCDMITMLGHYSSGIYAAHMYFGNISSSFGTIGTTGTVYFGVDSWASCDRVSVVDFNGDGKNDLMLIKDNNCEILTFDGWVAHRIYFSGFPTKWHLMFFGDFNGDGKTDILCRTSTTNNNAAWYKDISTGTGFVETPFSFSHTPDMNEFYYGDKLIISDFNGDGREDIAHGWNYFVNGISTSAKVDMYYSSGDIFTSEQISYSSTFVSSPTVFAYDADGDGRSDIMSRNYYGDPFNILYFNKGGKELLLNKVKNGIGHTTQWTYKTMTEGGTFYTRGNLTAQPLNNVQIPVNLVYEFNSENGIGGNTTVQYSYEEAKLHKEGKGLIGLKKISASDLSTNMKTVWENEFNTTFYTSAPYKASVYLTTTNTLLNEKTITNAFAQQGYSYYEKRFWTKVNSTYENKLFEKRYISSSNTYDAYGNVTQNVANINGEETTTTSSTYGTYGTPIPAKPTSVTVSNVRCCGPAAFNVTTTYTYNSLGQMTGKTDFSGQTKNVVSTYTYNNLGNLTGISVQPYNMAQRTEATGFDSKGRFPISKTNELSQTSTATYDAKWGKPLSETGVDGLTNYYVYDAFGRLSYTTLALGWVITETYGWDVNATEGTIHYHLTSHPGKPNVKVWYDVLNREKRTDTEGFQSQWITVKKTYDARGNIATQTAPYKSGESVLTTTTGYDTYNRLSSAVNTLGTTTMAYSYDLSGALTTTITNPANQVSSKVTDASGKLLSATDYGGTLNYRYNSQGNLIQVYQGTTVYTTSEYDDYGKQTKLTDINAGITQYSYDALGQMLTQTNALNQVTTMTYDLLGRVTQRSGVEGNTLYEYFPSNSSGATNKIKKITGFSGNLEEYTYDTYGRLTTLKETVDAVEYTTTYTYNIFSDVISMTYPSGFTINSTYDANGFLVNIKNGPNTETLYTNTGMNGFGQNTTYDLGNGKSSTNSYYFGIPTRYYTAGLQDLNLSWNYQSGNLSSRNDAIKGKTETFTYDNLNRLTSATVTGLSAMNVTYANSGNITNKTDVGGYAYYSTAINAVSYAANSSTNIPLSQQNISFTAFFQPSVISEGSNSLAYTYGADYQRKKGVLTQSGTVTDTRYYFGGYEKQVAGSSTKHLHYISVGQNTVAIVVRENSIDTYYYVYTDHLGSILTVTGKTGTVVAEQNFDPWGRKRNTTTWAYTGVQAVPTWLYRGYTGHEHLPAFNLINMNGRLYDPILARMLSPDNNIQRSDNTQSYNRYSYVFNNPLRFTDPNGEFAWIIPIIVAVVFAVGNVAAHAIAGETITWKNGLKYFAEGALAGFIVGTGVAAGLGVPILGGIIKTVAIVQGVLTVASLVGGGISNGWQGVGNAGKIFLGNFYLDENKSFFGAVWEGISRHTYQYIQTNIGLASAQFSNMIGRVEDVNYFGGATFSTHSYRTGSSVTLGNNILLSANDNEANFGVIGPGGYTFMHEYGHYIQSQVNGFSFFFKFGLPSAVKGRGWTEMDANLRASRYFSQFGFTWNTNYYTGNQAIYSNFPSNGKTTNTKWWEWPIFPLTVFWN